MYFLIFRKQYMSQSGSKVYGSLRNYKKHLRKMGVYTNPSETAFAQLAQKLGKKYIRKGYPDFMMLDDDGEIIGFVEVKPSSSSPLRPSQERFKRFCIRYGIPFSKWSPDIPSE